MILFTESDAEYRNMVSIYDLLAETRADDSRWPFEVKNLSIPTRREVNEYVALFGVNPLEAACQE